MKNQKLRLMYLLIVFTFMIAMLTGCQGNTPQTAQEEELVATEADEEPVVKNDTIVIAMADEPTSLNPFDHNAVYSDYMNQLTHNGLFRLDENSNPVPDLVESYESVSDTVWTFKIFEGIKFHNGSIMTSADVKASLDFAKTFPVISSYTASYSSVEIVDDLTVKVLTEAPSATILYDLASHANYIVPKALIDSGNDFNTNPIGSGPYKFVNWTLGDKIEFVMFDEYFDKTAMPTIKNIVWKFIPEGSARTIGLEAGEIDLLVEVATNDVARLKESANFVVIEQPGLGHSWLMINNEVAPFDNARVRKAINSAINRDSVIEVALNGMAAPAISQTPFGMLGETDVNAQGYDPEAAKQYLAESGVDPATIEIEIICSNEPKLRAAEVIQANLAEIGITKVTATSMDLATYLQVTGEGNYTASIGGYRASNMVGFLLATFDSSSIGSSNKTRLNNPDVDALIEKAASTVDPTEREKVLQECTELLNDLSPQVPLYQDMYIRAYNKDLGGVALNSAGVLRINTIYWK